MDWLIIGLGNPGPKYERTRHNIGFLVVQELARRSGAGFRERFKGRFADASVEHCPVGLLMPNTFMNLSGESVRPACDFYRVPPDRLLVVHDELDVPFGEVRLKFGGGEAGHRGLRSISQVLGTQDYLRLRMGIGRPPPDFKGQVADFVLQGFSALESAELEGLITHGLGAIERVVHSGVSAAMNQTNQKR